MTALLLTTDRLLLRKPDDRDTATAVAFLTSARAEHVGGPMAQGAAWRAHAKMVGHWVLRGFGLFTITDRATGTSLGMCGAYLPADWPEGELGWHIWRADREGRGIAFEAAVAVRAWIYRALGWSTCVSYIAPGNRRSIALAERMGARRDEAAARPDPCCLVFRHPGPGA